MTAFTGALRAEYRKVQSTKTWWVLCIILFGYTAMMAALFAVFMSAPELSGQASLPLDDHAKASLVYSAGNSLGYVLPIIFGTLLFTGEVRYQTLTPTFISSPRRITVLFAKLSIGALFGLAFAAAAILGAILPGAITLEMMGGSHTLTDPETLGVLLRIIPATILWVLLGLGIGSLITNQIAAVVVLLAFTQFVEPVLRMVSGMWSWSARVGMFLPSAASDALVGAGLLSMIGALEPSMPGHVESLDWWQGGGVLLILSAILLTIGYLANWRKDVS